MSAVQVIDASGATQVVAVQQATAVSPAYAPPASMVTVTPVGGIASTDAQSALAELDAEKQPLDAELTALAGLASGADLVPYFTGAGAAALAAFTALGRSLVACATAAAALGVLGTDAAGTARPPTAHNQAWSTITSTPASLAGYGITDLIALTNAANTFTAAQTIDLGSGALPAVIGTPSLRLSNADASATRQEAISFGATGFNFTARPIGGTRASPAATAAGQVGVIFSMAGYDTGYVTTGKGTYQITAGSLWAAGNNETVHIFSGCSSGSTALTEWCRMQGASLCIGAAFTSGNGLLQLASGTTKVNGIAYGTDTFMYRSAAGAVQFLASGTGATLDMYDVNATGCRTQIVANNSGGGFLQVVTNHPLTIKTNNIAAVTIDTAQAVTFAALCVFDGATGKTIKYTNPTTNGVVATTLGSVGPTGSTAGNPQGWVRINIGGTDRYIPFW